MRFEARNVVMKFGGLTAVDGVDFHVEQGEIVGLIGPNGSGKTTLLNVLSGVLKPTAGHFRLGTHEWNNIGLREGARLGIRRTFQNIRLSANLTALETVEVAAAWLGTGDRRTIALEALREMDFVGHADRQATALAYGLQRRLEIARAIAGKLEFLLLDEPTAGLNHTESDEIVRVVSGIRDRRGCGIILIDHDLKVILNACDRVAVLNEGKVIAVGKPAEIRRDPAVIQAYLG